MYLYGEHVTAEAAHDGACREPNLTLGVTDLWAAQKQKPTSKCQPSKVHQRGRKLFCMASRTVLHKADQLKMSLLQVWGGGGGSAPLPNHSWCPRHPREAEVIICKLSCLPPCLCHTCASFASSNCGQSMWHNFKLRAEEHFSNSSIHE